MKICRICDNSERHETFLVREMMFGSRETFEYFLCPSCGCLQIAEIPSDASKCYPPGYYSFNIQVNQPGHFKSWLSRKRDKYAISHLGITGRIMNWLYPDPLLNLYGGLHRETRVLDVGCGTGKLVWRLREAGLQNTSGIDPYNTEPIRYNNGLVIGKETLKEVSGEWDLITWHHSFEHIPNPLQELRKAHELLADIGRCIIRIPVVDSLAWVSYKTDWVQIDAPRHFFLHSKKSLGILAEKAGMEITRVEYDSTAFQFWGSEQYIKGIPLTAENSYLVNPSKSVFTGREIRSFEKRARELNRTGEGDQAIFSLKKKLNERN